MHLTSVYLMSGRLIGVHLTIVHLTGMCFIGLYLMGLHLMVAGVAFLILALSGNSALCVPIVLGKH